MEELSVVYIDPEKLTPWAGNAKQHPAWQVDQIKRSIEKYGMNDPVVVWGDHNIIVEGHGRLLACKELGMKEIPCIRLDYLTDEQRRAYTLAHNKITMETGLSFTALQERLLQIESTLEAVFTRSNSLTVFSICRKNNRNSRNRPRRFSLSR